ncbi:uncharacterized protein PAC_05094 [Phialocephala subalpina]|uniref:Uncharacterized protein n=1 Tax=Phialocephala subalpina TaxID=576137 RepID=A0A1L7WQZ9_9HELO|nr:uncharacterized protein PAC_05094 [Phialocephala subalpina]
MSPSDGLTTAIHSARRYCAGGSSLSGFPSSFSTEQSTRETGQYANAAPACSIQCSLPVSSRRRLYSDTLSLVKAVLLDLNDLADYHSDDNLSIAFLVFGQGKRVGKEKYVEMEEYRNVEDGDEHDEEEEGGSEVTLHDYGGQETRVVDNAKEGENIISGDDE